MVYRCSEFRYECIIHHFYIFKESRLSKHFYKNKEIEEIKHKDLAETPFQQQIVDYLYRNITSQKDKVLAQQVQIKIMNKALQNLFMILKHL